MNRNHANSFPPRLIYTSKFETKANLPLGRSTNNASILLPKIIIIQSTPHRDAIITDIYTWQHGRFILCLFG